MANATKGPIKVDRITTEDLEQGLFKASWSWLPPMDFPGMTPEQTQGFLEKIMIAYALSTAKGSWDGSKEWNVRLPDHKFVSAEDYLTGVWSDE